MASGNVIFEIKINAKSEKIAKEMSSGINKDLTGEDIHNHTVKNDGIFVTAAFTDDTYSGKPSENNYRIFLNIVGDHCHNHGICE